LTAEEGKVIELKYRGGQRFGHMGAPQVITAGKALLLKIHVITGWTIPEGDLMNILVDQFTKTLLEKYDDLNSSEIEYAFRSKGTAVEDWGKAMNLNLLDKVLTPYLNERFRISETERLLAYKKVHGEFSLDQLDYRRMMEEDFQFFLSGKTLTTFPVHYYKTLVEDALVNPDDHLLFEGATDDEKKDKCVLRLFEYFKAAGYKNLYVRE
jgi:hypothetical protein